MQLETDILKLQLCVNSLCKQLLDGEHLPGSSLDVRFKKDSRNVVSIYNKHHKMKYRCSPILHKTIQCYILKTNIAT